MSNSKALERVLANKSDQNEKTRSEGIYFSINQLEKLTEGLKQMNSEIRPEGVWFVTGKRSDEKFSVEVIPVSFDITKDGVKITIIDDGSGKGLGHLGLNLGKLKEESYRELQFTNDTEEPGESQRTPPPFAEDSMY